MVFRIKAISMHVYAKYKYIKEMVLQETRSFTNRDIKGE